MWLYLIKITVMREFYTRLSIEIQAKIQNLNLEGCSISLDLLESMLLYLKSSLSEMREYFLAKKSISQQEEIDFFKEIKPDILGMLLYFNKMYAIELKRPNGSNETQREYYEKELSSLTYFFERHLDFYQYYRAKSNYLDEYYFIRGKDCARLCADSVQYIHDPLFSTGFDYKVAKIVCNEMLRIYLNKKIHCLEKQAIVNKDKSLNTQNHLQWTASKIAAIELGYSLHSGAVFNNGNIDVKEILEFFEIYFNIELRDYYRTYSIRH